MWTLLVGKGGRCHSKHCAIKGCPTPKKESHEVVLANTIT